MIKSTILILTSTLIYAIIRYNVFGTVSYSDIPTLIVNKSISFSTIIFLAFASYYKLKHNTYKYDSYVQLFRTFVFMHVLLSMLLFSNQYYPKLYDGERLTFFANLAILTGLLGFSYLYNKIVDVIKLVLYFLIAMHLYFIASSSWFTPQSWNGGMPPISLLCFLLLLLTFLFELYYQVAIKKK